MQNIVEIPEDLALELDLLAKAEHKRRSSYVVDLLWQNVRRHKQQYALKLSSAAWKSLDHPELAEGGAAYVAQIRAEADDRFEEAIRGRQDP